MAYYPAIGTTDVSGIVDSLNTTEQTPRNIADVLAEELARIAENILPPNAEDITYDNTASGLTATNVQDAIDEVISSQADVIADTMADLTENKTATVTDGVADFETIDGSLVKSLVVEIEPSQSGSGTPSPDNIRPISGHTQEDVTVVGKNWAEPIPYRESNSVIFNPLSDGSISVQGTATGYAYSQVLYTLKAGNYIVCNDANVSNAAQLQIRRNSDDQLLLSVNYGQHRELSLESDTGIRLRLAVSSGNTVDAIIYPMIVLSTETDFSFEPYHGKTYTTPFNQTVYGGPLDVLSGELTIDRQFQTFDGSENWQANTTGTTFFYVNVASLPTGTEVVCNEFENKQITTTNDAIGVSANANSFRCRPSTSIASDVETFKTWLSTHPIEIVRYITTPTTITLTPQTVKSLVGENHISASTGEVIECKFSMLINGDDLEMLLS